MFVEAKLYCRYNTVNKLPDSNYQLIIFHDLWKQMDTILIPVLLEEPLS